MQTTTTTAPNTVVKFGAVAIQQALVLGLGLTYRRAAGLAQVNLRTLAGHVKAKQGSKCQPWGTRTPEVQAAAIAAAQALVDAANGPRYDFYFTTAYGYTDFADNCSLAWSSLTAAQTLERISANVEDVRRVVITLAGTQDEVNQADL